MLSKNEIRKKFRNFVNDEKAVGPILIVGLVMVVAFIGLFALMFILVIMNLETIGRGVMYFAVAVALMVGVAVIAKRFLITGKEVRS